jgi:hypothetical protein
VVTVEAAGPAEGREWFGDAGLREVVTFPTWDRPIDRESDTLPSASEAYFWRR